MTSSHTLNDDGGQIEAITEVVRDLYYGGWFAGDAERMRRSLHRDLVKRDLTDGQVDTDTAASMIEATIRGVGTQHPPERRRVEVIVDHVHGDIATAHATGDVYVDYLQLVRIDGTWSILNALWARA